MASITFLALIALATGFFFSYAIARKGFEGAAAKIFGTTFVALGLGIGLTFAAGLTHGICEDVFKICAPTSDTNVFNVSFPLMTTPLYWIVMIITSTFTKSKSESSSTQ